MKTHLNLATTNLETSVAFYATLLDVRPAKSLPDYALFIVDDPGMELALDLRTNVQLATDAHYGIVVGTEDDVDRAIARLSAAGLVASVQRNETCCYADQTKVWAIDPEGRRWEIYTVHDDTERRDDAGMGCCTFGDADRSCCAA